MGRADRSTPTAIRADFSYVADNGNPLSQDRNPRKTRYYRQSRRHKFRRREWQLLNDLDCINRDLKYWKNRALEAEEKFRPISYPSTPVAMETPLRVRGFRVLSSPGSPKWNQPFLPVSSSTKDFNSPMCAIDLVEHRKNIQKSRPDLIRSQSQEADDHVGSGRMGSSQEETGHEEDATDQGNWLSEATRMLAKTMFRDPVRPFSSPL